MVLLVLGSLLLITTKFSSSLGFSTEIGRTGIGRSSVDLRSKTNGLEEIIWGKAEIDYSAANEYIRAHYGEEAPRKPNYFSHQKRLETIFDARRGVRIAENNELIPATLKLCGFTLLSTCSDGRPIGSKITDWHNLDQIQHKYLEQLRDLLMKIYEPHGRTIRHAIFWNPMLRGKDSKQIRPPRDSKTTPTAGFASTPHIDMDVNAYESIDDFLDLLENNEIPSDIPNVEQRRQVIIHDILESRCGFAVVNAWCNVGSRPVANDPLGFFKVHYDDPLLAFPEAAPNTDRSKWYVFSDMSPGEILFFCQYDRDVTWASDIWHCGLTRNNESTTYPVIHSRESFDLRCFIVFDDAVTPEQDRYKRDRVGSLLSLEESGCFCEDQFEKRNRNVAESGN